jgi:hypothetical protein
MPSLVRARHMKTLVRAVDLSAADVAARFRALAGAQALSAVREATPLAWLPLAMNVDFSEIATEVLGPERAPEFFREMVLREFKTSLFKTFITGVTRAMNVTPAVFVKLHLSRVRRARAARAGNERSPPFDHGSAGYLRKKPGLARLGQEQFLHRVRLVERPR